MKRKVGIAVAFLIIVVTLYISFERIIFPGFPPQFQNEFVQLVSSLGVALALVAALAQISGFSIRDFLKEPSESETSNRGIMLVAKDEALISISGGVEASLRG